MALEVRRRLLIDRLSVVVVLGGDDLYKFVLGQLYAMEEEAAALLPNGHIKVRPGKYTTRLDWYAEYTFKKAGRRKVADIQIGATKVAGKSALHRFLRVTVYPSQFRAGDLERFRLGFDTFVSEITYDGLLTNGSVTYLELAADFLSHKQHSFIPYRTYSTKSKIFVEKSGYLGTTYVGSQSSKLHFRIYDKKKQLSDTGKPVQTSTFPHTRIEAVMTRLGVTPSALTTLDNPFQLLRISDLAKAKVLLDSTDESNFLSECQTIGAQAALAARPKHLREAYRKKLDSIPVNWWHPSEVWADLPQAARKIGLAPHSPDLV